MRTSVTSTSFGRLKDGRKASLFTLKNQSGAYVQFTDIGAALVSAYMPDAVGRLGPVALGFDTVARYEDNPAYIGPVIGPVSNRISGAQFTLEGKTHTLDANQGSTCLHSGAEGWHNKLWTTEITPQGLRFTYETPKDAGGFPGIITPQIDVSFDNNNRLTYHMQARTTASTPIAMTRHEYFNLTDGGINPIDDHIVQIHSAAFAEQSDDNTSNGIISIFNETEKSLATPKPLNNFKTPDGTLPFDCHNVVDGNGLRHMARVQSPRSGRQLDVFGTADGIQFYTGQALPKCQGAGGVSYGPCHGFALEAQARPNAVNHPHFPSIILQPKDIYQDTIIYAFDLID